MSSSGIARRSLLLAGGSAVVLAACSPDRLAPRLMDRGPVSTPAVTTVDELLARETFYVAHRGSGDNWPEHTLTAYLAALAGGADAVEISVCSTADGVLVCHHDISARRVLGVDRPIAEMTWAEVSTLAVDAQRWLGPRTPLEPVSTLQDVLAALGPGALAFIEDKQGTNTGALLDVLDAQPRSTERFVWKQWAGAAQVRVATERGYRSWGFFDVDQIDRLEEFAATFDCLGVPVAMADDLIEQVVATARPVMAWEVHFHDDVRRLSDLGVAGMMCSNIGYLLRAGVGQLVDDFVSGRRAAGDLPSEFDRLGWSAQPALVPERRSLRIQRAGAASYVMGSLADPLAPAMSVVLTMNWPEAVPPAGVIGAVVALTGDAPGGENERGQASGYEILLETSGEIRVDARERGTVVERLAAATLDAPVAGQAVDLVIDLEPDRLRISIADRQVLDVADARWRGAWVRLVKGYETSEAVEFTAIRLQ